MASATAPLDLIGLRRAISGEARSRLRDALRRLLKFQETLRGWPARIEAPSATPIVAVYDHGNLVGCAVHRPRASGGQRVARAFLATSGSSVAAWADPAVEVHYARRFRWVQDPDSIEVGSEGVALVGPSGPVLLMPQVARDFGVDARGFLELLEKKADGAVQDGRLAAWTTERVVARRSDVEEQSARARRATGATSVDYGAAWLARLVGGDGAVAFAIDPRRRIIQSRGELYHARSAFVIRALALHGGYRAHVRRARRFLAREIAAALRGERVEDWPSGEAAIAGTVAVAVHAGVDAREPLLRLARSDGLRSNAWHAAQVCMALGKSAPAELWATCVGDLRAAPFAPWTALAAKEVGDDAGYREAAASIARCNRRAPPHVGGANVTSVPESGLTAVAAHALIGSEHTLERDLAIAFVRARQLLPYEVPAPLDPTLALGGFSATPVNDLLRGDIVAHGLSLLRESDASVSDVR
jgi:hypothetical protein